MTNLIQKIGRGNFETAKDVLKGLTIAFMINTATVGSFYFYQIAKPDRSEARTRVAQKLIQKYNNYDLPQKSVFLGQYLASKIYLGGVEIK